MGVGIERDRRSAENPHEFQSVYRTHQRYVWQTLRTFGVPEAAADDAVQDVFLVVHRRLGEFEGRAAIRTWLFEILRRVAWRYRTKAQRDASRSDALPELAGSVDLEADLERAQAFEVLQSFADQLDEDRLRVFTLSVFGQLRGREISEALGVNLNTVYARLRSAHAAFDRFTIRLHAREAAVAVRAARASRRSSHSVQRTWAALALQVGAAPVGVAAATAAGAGWTAWIWVGAAALATTVVATVAVTSTTSAENPSAQTVAPVVRTAQAGSAKAQPAATQQTAAAAPALVEAMPVAAHAPESAVATRARTQHLPATDARQPSGQRLAQQVAAVKAIQSAVDKRGDVGTAVRDYHRQFPQGTLREEVEGLVIEDLCNRGDDATQQLSAFRTRRPASTLLLRLEKACGVSIPPQKPQRPKTPSL